MVRVACSNNDLSAIGTASGSTGQLGDKEKGALCTAKVGHVEDMVHPQHYCSLNVRKIVPFGDELGADQYPAVGATKFASILAWLPLARVLSASILNIGALGKA